MNLFDKELDALKRRGLFRERSINDETRIDLASNDYLGFAHDKKLLKKTCKHLSNYHAHAPKASLLVNGYSTIHRKFEQLSSKLNGFEETIVVGSGFLANLSLIEAMVREGDLLYMDEEYHASGIMATRLIKERVRFFRHNNPDDLKKLLRDNKAKRTFIAVEGIYSMGGDILKKEFFDIANEYGAILIVDEAHSSGVVGEHLLGVYDHYRIPIEPHHIKMGTLGKAMGSYGAYICASSHIIAFLLNRAKPIIYSTAPSLYDIEYARLALKRCIKQRDDIKDRITQRQLLAQKYFAIKPDGLILAIPVRDNHSVMQLKQDAKELGFDIGAIRPPTVKSPIVRIILRIDIKLDTIETLFRKIKEFL
jgi:8-amino-7-oxononanoate synthase